jgi:CDP-diacylglycerol--glycerol-3-phosphate 3-phosphatidyltransferase
MLKVFYNKTRSFSTSCIQRAIFDNNSTLQVLKPLQSLAPTFYTHGENITPLYQPSEFYSELRV